MSEADKLSVIYLMPNQVFYMQTIDGNIVRLSWYLRLWLWVRFWNARRVARSYTIVSEETADNLYEHRS